MCGVSCSRDIASSSAPLLSGLGAAAIFGGCGGGMLGDNLGSFDKKD